MRKRCSCLAIGSLLAIALLGGCGMARVKTTWKAPNVQTIRFEKVVAFVVVKDEAIRRNGEHELCKQIKTVPCAPAYAVVADANRGNVDALAQQVDAAGFDGAVVLRYAGQRTQQTYVPAAPAAPLWGYYGYGWGTAYDPGYVRQDQLVAVETAVYSVPDRKLLWVGTTESMNPREIRRTVEEIANAVAAEMRKEGLIPPN